jgi:DNA-binding transcriptional regulator YhcF (GntR family)
MGVNPNHARSREVRAVVRTLLPPLDVGAVLPSAPSLAPALGCNRAAAHRHLRGAMADAGVVLETRRGRLVVREMPQQQEGASP